MDPMTTRAKITRAALALVLVSAMLSQASPAAAAVNCELVDTLIDTRLTIDADEDVTLEVDGPNLLVNGAVCGPLTPIVQFNPSAVIDVVVDAGEIWPDPFAGQPFQDEYVQLNVDPLPDGSTLRILGSGGRETMAWSVGTDGFGTLRVQEGNFGDFRLIMVFATGNSPDIEFDLRGGRDRFDARLSGTWPGTVTVLGGGGSDIIEGTAGNDTLIGGPGKDEISGGPGRDNIQGNGGKDILNGNGGRDTIDGGGKRDTANGGAGRDTFIMNDGSRDTIDGGRGRDRCTCDANDRTTSV